jgi:type IV secretory pathway VirB2 component (pilin)
MKRIALRISAAIEARRAALVMSSECVEKQFRRWAPIGMSLALMFQSSLALAYSDDGILTPFQNLLTWICGPFALVVSGFALVGALISYMIQGNQHLPRFIAAVVGGIGLFLVQKIVTFMAGQAQ